MLINCCCHFSKRLTGEQHVPVSLDHCVMFLCFPIDIDRYHLHGQNITGSLGDQALSFKSEVHLEKDIGVKKSGP